MVPTPRRPLPALPAAGLALATLLALLGGAVLGPGVARAMGPLPPCHYAEIETAPLGYGDWSITLVDTILRVPSTYAPPDLVSTKQAGLAGGGSIRKVALADLKAMTAAARAAGAPIAVQSAYRSYAQQEATFQHWVSTLGFKGALKVSARPGHSEHQLGLAIDFRSDLGGPPWSGADWAKSPAGSWMLSHAWTYGWLLSYPRDAIDTVCYSYEPWHYRYVGRMLAAVIHDAGLTIRAYLWANVTTAIVPPIATASASPGPGSSGSPSANPSEGTGGSSTPSTSGEPSPGQNPTPVVPPTATEPSPATTEPPAEGGLIEGLSPGGLAIIGLGLALIVGLGLLIAARARPRSGRRF